MARVVVYKALNLIAGQEKDPLEIFSLALKNVSPKMELKSKRIGGANYQIPREVSADRGTTLAMRWIIGASRKRKGGSMSKRLADEILNGSREQGDAFKKKIDTHKMAEANKAFAHFARF